MHADLAARRRLLVLAYQRYMEADRSWNVASEETRAWFPKEGATQLSSIGNPGSRMRALYERRAKAIAQLEVARIKLEVGKQRLAGRDGMAKTRHILFIAGTVD